MPGRVVLAHGPFHGGRIARMNSARLLIDPALTGPENMARDEALLRACLGPEVKPVVRLYAWSPPTISLGYFQAFSEYENLLSPAGELPVVRRTTGGGAILHDLEVTYSIVLPTRHPLVCGRPVDLYRRVHRAIIRAVGHGARLVGEADAERGLSSHRGPFFCFDRRHALDVCVDDTDDPSRVAKIAGSAQRRTQTAILQHGSIMLASRFQQQGCATWSRLDASIDFAEAVARLVPALERQLGWLLDPAEWPAETAASARRLVTRYESDMWTIERRRDVEVTEPE